MSVLRPTILVTMSEDKSDSEIVIKIQEAISKVLDKIEESNIDVEFVVIEWPEGSIES